MKALHLIYCFLWTFVFNGISNCFEDDSIVQTQYGPVQGVVTSLGRAFTSIPYAAPPVDDLRWSNPQSPEKWTNVLDTTSDPPGCAQVCVLPSFACPTKVTEDCLYLNVFTPPMDNNNINLTTMVFIHGGSYEVGYSGGWLYNGTDLALINNVIVVTINYRLGVLGSLYDPSNNIYGNLGYLDQKFAIEWVYKNIENFGGNTKSITIFGESAGASSVSLHLTDNDNIKNGPKFNGAIMESNPIGLRLRNVSDWDGIRSDFYNYLGCSSGSCLYSKSMDEILAAQTECSANIVNNGKFVGIDMLWTPTIISLSINSSSLLSYQPLIAFQKRNFVSTKWSVNIINGVNNNESMIFTQQNMTEDDYNRAIDEAFGESGDSQKVKDEYASTLQSLTYSETYSMISTDAGFKCSNHNATYSIKLWLDGSSDIYFYHFDGSASFGKYLLPSSVSQCWDLPCHESELPFIFRPNFGGLNYKGDANHEAKWTQPELSLAQGMQKYWGNLAKNGKPGIETINNQSADWLPYDYDNLQPTMVFTVNTTGVISNYNKAHCDFWADLGYNWL